MATLSIRTLTPANPKAKTAADERGFFFREQYRAASSGLAGKKNASGREYTKVEGGNHNSRNALRKALERLAESPTAPQDTEVVIIADYAFLSDGLEEERRLVKEGGKEKVVKEEVKREGLLKLLETLRGKFRKMTVLVENSPDGPHAPEGPSSDRQEPDKQMAWVRQAEASGKEQAVQILHVRSEVTPEAYAGFIRASTGLTP